MFDGNTFTQFGTLAKTFTELGRATGTGSSTTLTVSSFANKKWLLCLLYMKCAANANVTMQFNSDTGSNYANRVTQDGSADATTVSQTTIKCDGGQTVVAATGAYAAIWIENSSSSNEKLVIGHTSHGDLAGAGNAPDRTEYVSKWSNTSNAITTITITSTSNFSTDSELIVLGADPTDTNVTPFFTELGRGSGTGSAVNVDITLSASKKYNMFTMQSTPPSAGADLFLVVGNGSYDTGNNYSWRGSNNGAADTTQTSQPKTWLDGNKNITNGCFGLGFGINVAANEKLFFSHNNLWSSTGAGNAPDRSEDVGKWTNTSNQYDRVRFTTLSGGNLPTTSEFVWYGAN